MQSCNAKTSKQRVQYYNIAKVDYIICLITKVDITRQIDFSGENQKDTDRESPTCIFSLKINKRTNFKDNVGSTQTVLCINKKKTKYWGVYVEIIKS